MAELVVVEILLARSGEKYTAELQAWQDSGEHSTGGTHPVSLNLEALRASEINPEAYGRALTEALFADPDLRSEFAEARTLALDGVLRLRLCVNKNAPELHYVHWELLRDPDDDDQGFLSMHEDIVFSRFLLRGRLGRGRGEQPEPRHDLSALAAAANPLDLKDRYDLPEVKVDGEHARACACLTGMQVDLLPTSPGERCTIDNLLDRLRGHDILYLACHGKMVNDAPWLLLEDADGRAARISGKRLVEGIADLPVKPRLVILASCESAGGLAGGNELASLGQRLVMTAGVPAVVAMQGPVSMPTVEKFMPAFFTELMRDGQIDRAMADARRTISDAPDFWVPVLYMNMFRGELWLDPARAPVQDDWIKPRILERPETSFFGRQGELERMKTAARGGENGQAVQVMEIWGAGGAGKTALARQLIEGLNDLFPDGQIEIDLRGKGTDGTPFLLSAAQALQTLLRGVSTHPDLALPGDAVELRRMYLARLIDRKVAILLDDVVSPGQALPFLPPPRNCLVLVTSSMRLPELPDLWDFKLGQMPVEDAVKILLALAPRAQYLAGQIVEACDRLPQCVYRVCTTLRERGNLPVEVMLARLQDPALALKETGIEDSFQSTCDLLPADLLASWRSLAVIDGAFDELAAAAVWGWITCQSTPAERADVWDRANQRLGELLDYGILEYEEQRQCYALLRLVRAYAAEKMGEEEREAVEKRYEEFKRG